MSLKSTYDDGMSAITNVRKCGATNLPDHFLPFLAFETTPAFSILRCQTSIGIFSSLMVLQLRLLVHSCKLY